MTVPAIIICEPDTAAARVAGLSLLDRLAVTLHRAGCSPIAIVSPEPLPPLDRTNALGIPYDHLFTPPESAKPVLVATTGVLTNSNDVRRVIEGRGRLLDETGNALPLGLAAEAGDFPARLDGLCGIRAAGVAVRVDGPDSLARAERRLWASITSAADGIVDRRFNRPLGRLLSRRLIQTDVTPNQVSVVATLLGVISAACFAAGEWRLALAGAVLLQISAIIDCIDGDLARVVFKESPFGRWLDLAGDQVVHISVFVAIAVGLARAGSAAPVAWLGASAGIGVLISFAVVVRGLMQPESLRNTRLRKLIDATANRDFSVLLLFLVAVDHLELFLWMTAFGVHLFWIAALMIQLLSQPAARLEIQGEERS